MQAGLLLFGNFAGARHAQSQLVAEPERDEVHHARDDEKEQCAARTADEAADGNENASQQSEQHSGAKGVHQEAGWLPP